MRRKVFRFILILLAGLIALVLWQPWILKIATGEGRILSKSTGYRVTNEGGKEINAEFYLKKVNWKGKELREIVIRFVKFPTSEYWESENYYLILVPQMRWIGRPNQSKKIIKKLLRIGFFKVKQALISRLLILSKEPEFIN